MRITSAGGFLTTQGIRRISVYSILLSQGSFWDFQSLSISLKLK